MKQYDPSCLSPLYFHIHLLVIFFSAFSFSLQQAYGSSNETDQLALLQFKQGISSDPNGVLSSWNGSNYFCNWFGVSCGRRHQRVVSLDLQGHNLKGFLSPYVGNLSFLRILNVQNNSLQGQIPSEIEYGLGGIASKEGDLYSFGILVLELFSGKKPTHEMFTDGLNLHDFVKHGLPQSLWEVADPSMQPEETEREVRTRASTSITDHTNKLRESLISIFKVGLVCSTLNPIQRQKIGDALKELHSIKSTFQGVRIYG